MTNRVNPLSSLALLATLATSLAHAAAPLEVEVAGRVKPASPICLVSLPKAVQYGVIPLEKIKPDGITMLDEKFFVVTVGCGESAKFSVQFIDLRHGSAVDDAPFLAEVAQTWRDIDAGRAFGLGLDGTGQKIGAMFMRFATINYQPSNGTWYSAEAYYRQGQKWVRDDTANVRYQTPYTFAPERGPAPIALSGVRAYVRLLPVLDSGRLDLTRKIEVGGRLTLEISQL
jgi:hypothetical protein